LTHSLDITWRLFQIIGIMAALKAAAVLMAAFAQIYLTVLEP